MARPPIRISLENELEFRKALAELPPALRERGLKDALRRAGRQVVSLARSLVPVASGTLKKSLGLVLRSPRRGRRGDPYVVLGPRKGFSREVVRDGRTRKANPANYAHLVEFGHHIVVGGTLYDKSRGRWQRRSRRSGRTGRGKSVQFFPARPFLRPAFSKGRAQVLSTLVSSLRTFQEREAKRIARRMARKGAA